MQYPIIDNLIYAYLRNGWTGVEFNGMNIWDEQWELGTYNLSTGEPLSTNLYFRTKNFIEVTPNTSYYIHTGTDGFWIFVYNREYEYIGYFRDIRNNIFTTGNETYFIRFVDITTNTYEPSINGISINYPSLYTQYISNMQSNKNINAFNNDVSHRLKLPMVHYFPHPVIDALISAADGQHTDEEKEILRHYLTPLGIGGV